MLDALTYPFMQRALAAGVLVGVMTSLLGVLVVLRRSAFFGDAIAHAALTGVAIGVLTGWHPLLAAVGDLARTLHRPLTVVFLGDGDLRAALEAESRALHTVRAEFLGFKNQRELSPYYHAADVMVLPSQHSETWGLVVNEALMHGVPCVVSSAVGCGDDLIVPGRTGEVFEVGSRDSLVAALTRVGDLVGRIDIRDACRAQVARYSVDRAACGIAQAYRSVVGA